LNGKIVAIRVIVAIIVISAVAYFYSDYILGLLAERPDFQLSANPTQIRLSYVGSSNTTTITVMSINGLDSDVKLDAKPYLGLIGARFIFDPSEVHLQANGEVSCTLRIYAMSNIEPGEYFIDISGVAGNLTRSIRVTVEVSY